MTKRLPYEKMLLSRVAYGDEKAFESIFDHYRPKIFAYAFHLFGSREMADELVQEVFLKLWLSRDKIPGIEKFDAWLFIVARNQVFDTLKVLSKETSVRSEMAGLSSGSGINSVENNVIYKENEQFLQDALRRLSPQQKLVFTLSRHLGMKHEEIASRLNISRHTVKTHLVHALKTLRNVLLTIPLPLILLSLLISCEHCP